MASLRRAVLWAAALCAGAAGCTVDLGAVPDAAPCHPSTSYFVDPLWPQYIDANQCATSACHAFADGHGYFRLRAPGTAPLATAPIDQWPDAWRDNYLASIQLFDCAAPLQSRLLTVPEGKADPHPPGVSVPPSAQPLAESLIQGWATAP
jgi:hypothetical protein